MAEDIKNKLPTDLLLKIKDFIKDNYEPVQHVADADFHYNTYEFFGKIQSLFPSDEYAAADVSVWLNEMGFCFSDFGELQFEWLFKKIN